MCVCARACVCCVYVCVCMCACVFLSLPGSVHEKAVSVAILVSVGLVSQSLCISLPLSHYIYIERERDSVQLSFSFMPVQVFSSTVRASPRPTLLTLFRSKSGHRCWATSMHPPTSASSWAPWLGATWLSCLVGSSMLPALVEGFSG